MPLVLNVRVTAQGREAGQRHDDVRRTRQADRLRHVPVQDVEARHIHDVLLRHTRVHVARSTSFVTSFVRIVPTNRIFTQFSA